MKVTGKLNDQSALGPNFESGYSVQLDVWLSLFSHHFHQVFLLYWPPHHGCKLQCGQGRVGEGVG